jgi:hypothetical protein
MHNKIKNLLLCFTILISANLLITIYDVYIKKGRDNIYNPQPSRRALETTWTETGFEFYFTLKQIYFGKDIYLPDFDIIDVTVLKRLSLMDTIKVKKYEYLLDSVSEETLLNQPQKRIFYFPKIRHPASQKPVGKKMKFTLVTGSPDSKAVYFYQGKTNAYFIPDNLIGKAEIH